MYKVIEYHPTESPADLESWLSAKLEHEGLMLVTTYGNLFIFLQMMVLQMPITEGREAVNLVN